MPVKINIEYLQKWWAFRIDLYRILTFFLIMFFLLNIRLTLAFGNGNMTWKFSFSL